MIFMLLAIVYHSAFEIGYVPRDNMQVYVRDFWDEVAGNKVNLYFDLEATIEMNKFYIGGGVKTFAGSSKRDRLDFIPYKATYRFLAGYKFNEKLEIGFRHYCIHPVVPYVTFGSPIIFQGGYEEFYIKFEN